MKMFVSFFDISKCEVDIVYEKVVRICLRPDLLEHDVSSCAMLYVDSPVV